MYFDTHAHYDSEAFAEDRDLILSGMPEQGVDLIVNPGCDGPSSRAAVALSEKYGFVYAAVAWHPEEWESWDQSSLPLIRELALRPKTVAVGETGLDYYWDKEHKELQKEMFRAHMALARELDLPVIVHDREAHADCLSVIAEFPEVGGVFHCFSGSAEMAEHLIKRGWYLGFDGPVTYAGNAKAGEVLAVCPLERILLETDSPYLTPVPNRGKRNHSGNLCYTARRVAELKGVTPEQLAEITKANGQRLYRI